MGLRQIIVVGMLFVVCNGNATVYYSTNFESKACNSVIQDAEYVQGKLWDLLSGDPTYPFPSVRCEFPVTSNSNYVRWTTICTGYSAAGRCSPANNTNATTNAAGVEIVLGNSSFTPVEGTTYYLGAHFRFDRISNRDVWQDSGMADSFDKLMEMGCGGCNFRWGIGSGWPSGNHMATDHKFTFDAWCASTAFAGCQTPNNPDHKPQNANGYNASSPFLADYEKWYSVVLAVTASTNATTGRVRLYINGTTIIDKQNITMGSNSATSDRIFLNGTIAQPSYDVPSHHRYVDNIVFTNSLVDIQNAGLMQDPQSTTPPTGSPRTPTNLRVN
ncbi:MAG: hypothetical protein A4S09_10935 [Proteobacteria bacterium SG_bin7]|nr:MAG: hypothetical protein A4S09_10935 [Proteobacteria bacterium SG_bin7]